MYATRACRVILDGEMLVWEPHMQKYMAFGNLKSFAKNKVDDVSDFDPRPCCKRSNLAGGSART